MVPAGLAEIVAMFPVLVEMKAPALFGTTLPFQLAPVFQSVLGPLFSQSAALVATGIRATARAKPQATREDGLVELVGLSFMVVGGMIAFCVI